MPGTKPGTLGESGLFAAVHHFLHFTSLATQKAPGRSAYLADAASQAPGRLTV
jgi:hypothetical protein